MTWHERIAAARVRGYFTEEDCDLVGDWVTCACGEQDPRIPRYSGKDVDTGGFTGGLGAPVDDELFHLGAKFYSFVKNKDFNEAETTLADIEKRAAHVLAEVVA